MRPDSFKALHHWRYCRYTVVWRKRSSRYNRSSGACAQSTRTSPTNIDDLVACPQGMFREQTRDEICRALTAAAERSDVWICLSNHAREEAHPDIPSLTTAGVSRIDGADKRVAERGTTFLEQNATARQKTSGKDDLAPSFEGPGWPCPLQIEGSQNSPLSRGERSRLTAPRHCSGLCVELSPTSGWPWRASWTSYNTVTSMAPMHY